MRALHTHTHTLLFSSGIHCKIVPNCSKSFRNGYLACLLPLFFAQQNLQKYRYAKNTLSFLIFYSQLLSYAKMRFIHSSKAHYLPHMNTFIKVTSLVKSTVRKVNKPSYLTLILSVSSFKKLLLRFITS